MARRRHHEEHENHERWAIPYGDLVTLLLAFFVVMYSISSVNEGKYRVVSNSLSEAFGGTPRTQRTLNSDLTSMQEQQLRAALPIDQVDSMIASELPDRRLGVPLPGSPKAVTQTASQLIGAAAGAAAQAGAAAGSQAAGNPADMQEQRELGSVTDDVTKALQALIAAGQVHVRRFGSWIAVDISTDILFDSGVAHLSPAAVQALERLAAALAPWPNSVRVEGHTDDRPIRTAEYPSNWELSAARAASVVHLFMDHGIAPERLAVLGFGQYRPAGSNTTAVGRNANRRVAIVILGRNAAPEAGL
jgi:chemotaxis protein MotB